MADDHEKFLARWSRLKGDARERTQAPEPPKAESPADAAAPPPDLPPPEKLDFESDYRGFFHPKVDEDTRRAALKKLFSDARFNVIDPLDIDIDDYSKLEPLSAAAAASLEQARKILAWAKEREEDEDRRRRTAEQARLARAPDALSANSPSPESQPEEAPAHAHAGRSERERVDPEDAANAGNT